MFRPQLSLSGMSEYMWGHRRQGTSPAQGSLPLLPQPHLQVEAAGDSAEPRGTEKAQDVPVV